MRRLTVKVAGFFEVQDRSVPANRGPREAVGRERRLTAPRAFEPGMEVLQTGPETLSC
jgi:hypothetical protein